MIRIQYPVVYLTYFNLFDFHSYIESLFTFIPLESAWFVFVSLPPQPLYQYLGNLSGIHHVRNQRHCSHDPKARKV